MAQHRDDAPSLYGDNIGSLRSLFALLNIELNCLAFVHTVILPIAGTVMKKDISRSFDGNETEPFLGFLFNGSCGHEKRGKEKILQQCTPCPPKKLFLPITRYFLTPMKKKAKIMPRTLRVLPPLPIQKKYAVCLVKECGKDSYGRQYCEKHTSVDLRRKLPNTLRAHIRSHCCSAKCVSGKAHENGEQYCAKCKEPCCWKTQ